MLFAVKLWDLEKAAEQLRPLVGGATRVITVQNGIDAVERLEPILGEDHVVAGYAQIATVIGSPGVIAHTSQFALMRFGHSDRHADPPLAAFADAAQKAGLDVALAENIDVELWNKFVFLSSLAGATAATRQPIGPILADPDTRALFHDLLREVVAVGRAKGVALPADHADKTLAFAEETLPPGMKASMAHDLERGNRLELDWLTGKVAALGRELGVPTPASAAIYAVLKPHRMGRTMKRSTERFLTTHTGSLPRPDDLIRMMYAKEEGVPVDRAALAARIRSAVAEVVSKQAEAGIDLVNDGEMSKPSYATYVKDRLAGFGGTGNTFVYQDLADFPNLAKRVFGDPGRSRRKTPACNAPISVRDAGGRRGGRRQPQGRARQVKAAGAFMSAASPGVVSLFFRNDHYKDHEDYLFAIADAMRHEYETVAKAGIMLQIDCPDLAMGRHIQYAELDLAEFRKRARDACRGAQPCARQHPARAAAHACVLGQLRRPAPLRRAARRHHRHRVQGAAERDLVRGRQPAPRPRMDAVRAREAAGRQGADPRRARIEVELHRASRADRAAHRPLRQPGRARERHRRQRLRLRHLGRAGGGRPRRGVGEVRGHGRRRADRVAAVLEVIAKRPSPGLDPAIDPAVSLKHRGEPGVTIGFRS